MKIYLLYDVNYGNIDNIYRHKPDAEERQTKINKQSKEIYNGRYQWIIREEELI